MTLGTSRDAAPLARAVRLLETIERRSAVVRMLETRPRSLRGAERHAVADGARRSAARLELALPASGDVLAHGRADAVVLARTGDECLRFRAFYLDAGFTIAVHGEIAPWRPSRLMAGAATLARVRAATPLVVPDVLERRRRPTHAWATESWIDGQATRAGEWSHVAATVARGLVPVWHAFGTRLRAVREVLRPDAVGAALSQLGDGEVTVTARVAAAADRLARSRDMLRFGTTHGDPVRPNVLRLGDGQIALVDWEWAGEGALARDLVKLSLGGRTPGALASIAAEAFPPTGRELDWSRQMAVWLIEWLGSWSVQRARARARDRDAAFLARLRRRVELLAALLE